MSSVTRRMTHYNDAQFVFVNHFHVECHFVKRIIFAWLLYIIQRLRHRIPSQSNGTNKKSTPANASNAVASAAASTKTATTTTKLRNPNHMLTDIQYKLIKLKAHGLDSDNNAESAGDCKEYEEKYSNQLEISEAYQVEYDADNLQGALIVNSDGIDPKLINNSQSKSNLKCKMEICVRIIFTGYNIVFSLFVHMTQNETTKHCVQP